VIGFRQQISSNPNPHFHARHVSATPPLGRSMLRPNRSAERAFPNGEVGEKIHKIFETVTKFILGDRRSYTQLK
jgi:hypothetical protein